MVFVALAVLVPGLVIWAWRSDDRTRILTGLGLAALVGAAIVIPVAWQYRDLQEDPHFRRDPDPSGYAQLSDFLRVTPENYLLADIPPFESRSRPESATIERRLYPGIPAVGLGIVGFVVLDPQAPDAARRPPDRDPPPDPARAERACCSSSLRSATS